MKINLKMRVKYTRREAGTTLLWRAEKCWGNLSTSKTSNNSLKQTSTKFAIVFWTETSLPKTLAVFCKLKVTTGYYPLLYSKKCLFWLSRKDFSNTRQWWLITIVTKVRVGRVRFQKRMRKISCGWSSGNCRRCSGNWFWRLPFWNNCERVTNLRWVSWNYVWREGDEMAYSDVHDIWMRNMNTLICNSIVFDVSWNALNDSSENSEKYYW